MLLLLTLAMLLLPTPSKAQTAPAKHFVMATDAAEGFGYRYSGLIYDEAFKRLGIPLEMTVYSLARRSVLIEQGAIDGEASRVYSYADAHPELIRVEEPVMTFTFSLFTAKAALRAKRLDDLPADTLAEYRRGIMLCENTLAKSISAERLSSIITTEQGIKKLLAGRSDVFCDIDVYVFETLQSAEFKGIGTVRKLFDIISMPTYPYLFKRHAELAPRLAATLKKMKAEGLMERYRIEAERGAAAGR
ncbi:MAG: hypothetical protein WCV99_02315 [Sterolibacterium sp.]